MITHSIFLCIASMLLFWGASALIRRTRGPFRVILTGLAVGVALTGLAGSFVASRLYPTLGEHSATIILQILPPAFMVAIPLAFLSVPVLRLRNPLGTIDPILPGAILALTLGGVCLGLKGWHEFSNGYLDDSPERARQATVIEMTAGTPLSRSQKVVVEVDGKKIMLRKNELSLEVGETIEIRTKKGFQNMEWICGAHAITP